MIASLLLRDEGGEVRVDVRGKVAFVVVWLKKKWWQEELVNELRASSRLTAASVW